MVSTALQIGNILGAITLVILLIGGSALLMCYRKEPAVRARGMGFLLLFLWLSALRVALPIVDVLHIRSSLSGAECVAVVLVSLISLDVLIVTMCTRMLRLALFAIIQRAFQRIKLLELETDIASGENDSGPQLQLIPLQRGAQGHEGTERIEVATTDMKEDGDEEHPSSATDFNYDFHANTALPEALTNFFSYATGNIFSKAWDPLKVEEQFPSHFHLELCGSRRCTPRRMHALLCLAGFPFSVRYTVLHLHRYLLTNHLRYSHGSCTLLACRASLFMLPLLTLLLIGILLSALSLLPAVFAGSLGSVFLGCHRDRVGLRWEAIANAIILVGVGVAAFLPLAATSQQEQEFRYFRRMLLLWVQNFIIAFTVLLPVGYAIVSHKHRRRFNVRPHDAPLLENPQPLSPLRIRVTRSANDILNTLAIAEDGSLPDSEREGMGHEELFRDDVPPHNVAASFVVTLRDVWSTAALKAVFFNFLRSEYKLHYATFYDDSSSSALRLSATQGLLAFCQFYLRICNVYFSSMSAVDIVLGTSLYNQIIQLSKKVRELRRRLGNHWRSSSQLPPIPEAESMENPQPSGRATITMEPHAERLIRMPTGIQHCYIFVTPLEQRAMVSVKFQIYEAVMVLYSARVAVWRELEETSLPRFIVSAGGHRSLIHWRRGTRESSGVGSIGNALSSPATSGAPHSITKLS